MIGDEAYIAAYLREMWPTVREVPRLERVREAVRRCKGCGLDLPRPSRPGRPRSYCTACRPSHGRAA